MFSRRRPMNTFGIRRPALVIALLFVIASRALARKSLTSWRSNIAALCSIFSFAKILDLVFIGFTSFLSSSLGVVSCRASSVAMSASICAMVSVSAEMSVVFCALSVSNSVTASSTVFCSSSVSASLMAVASSSSLLMNSSSLLRRAESFLFASSSFLRSINTLSAMFTLLSVCSTFSASMHHAPS